MSTTEIPIGNGEQGLTNKTNEMMEQAKTEIEKGPTGTNNNKDDISSHKEVVKADDGTGKKKMLIGGGILLIVVIIAVVVSLVVVLPDWNKKETTNGNSYNNFEGDGGARADLEMLAKSIVNKVILDGASPDNNNNNWAYSMDETDGALEASKSDGSGGGDSGAAFAGVDDFETYQHEAGVVKNDLVKSNGVHVFAAVDDSILVWDLAGTLLESIPMPEIDIPDQSDDNNYYRWKPKPYIQALLMNPLGDKLTVVVSGYGTEYDPIKDGMIITRPIIYSYMETRIIVYDIEGDKLTKLSQKDVNGYHVDSYAVGNNVHVVTKMSLNTYDHLTTYLQRYAFKGMDDDEYIEAAILKAEEIIPDFVDNVMDVVTVDDNVILSRLAVFVDSISDSSDTYMSDLFGGGIADTITQVNSFDMSTTGSEENMELDISKAAILQPGNSGYVYATDEWIWVTDQGWNWDIEENKYAEKTMLLGFRFNGASSTFSAVGSVEGRLLSQFSIDFVKSEDKEDGNIKEYLRIATTESFFQRFWWGAPRPMQTVFVEEDNSSIEQEVEEESRTKNQIIIFEVPKVDDNNRQNNELVRLGSVELGKKDETITAVRFFDNISYVVTFERTDPSYVLDLSDPKKPTVLGELEIPGFSEFMHPITNDNSVLITVGQDADEEGNILGFQVSIFDSTIPTDPVLIDRLVIEDDDGSWSGSSASWDERAFRYLKVGDLGRLIIPVSVYSRWGSSGEKIGDDFVGFMVFGVDLTKTENIITREFEVDHSQNREEEEIYALNKDRCYCGYSWLPERSMVFDANVMTMRNQKVVSTNLVTHETQWNFTLKDDENCCNP
ncbi:hemopexin domain-containing protein [Fragilariopsis cylindrus CCMP1102]|uniref:Hemopexin domain-containing protein n=1 Tax=Fragilariopsis cylindrus CCMP1102 TaxID=635003 RepID=A0A1E7FAW7_9STRA|nr:hemopexin domain-containing protein [Fragilariopsis cylindrus CCMP1102]|eukprot:OEU15308.1 hemopexin domain-containing protein [Fragilariopsis cylindrus CCMP1102]